MTHSKCIKRKKHKTIYFCLKQSTEIQRTSQFHVVTQKITLCCNMKNLVICANKGEFLQKNKHN